MSFPEWFAGLLDSRGLRQNQAARLIGVSPATIRLWKLGASIPSWDNCAKIADGLGLDVGQVRILAGYHEQDTPLDVTPEEGALLRAYRTATPDGQQALLAIAVVISANRVRSRESGLEDGQRPE